MADSGRVGGPLSGEASWDDREAGSRDRLGSDPSANAQIGYRSTMRIPRSLAVAFPIFASCLIAVPTVGAAAGGSARHARQEVGVLPHSTVPNGELDAVSCVTSRACEAVGTAFNASGAVVTLAEAWNGTKWAIQPTPAPGSGLAASVLDALACHSLNDCVAVGYSLANSGSSATLVEAWNGTKWAVVSSPNPTAGSGARLAGVSCAGTGSCMAVGSYLKGSVSYTLGEAWNGTNWKVEPTPNASASSAVRGSLFLAVSCASLSSCVATGFSLDKVDQVPLAASWNGTTWVLDTTATPSGSYSVTLGGVSCSKPTTCTAVGYYDKGKTGYSLAEGWRGAAWTIQTTPNVTGKLASSLQSVSCGSKGCVAVGQAGGVGDTWIPLAESSSAEGWALGNPASPKGSVQVDLVSVSCSGPSICEAVGNYFNSDGVYVSLAEIWNGTTWALQATPNPSGVIG